MPPRDREGENRMTTEAGTPAPAEDLLGEVIALLARACRGPVDRQHQPRTDRLARYADLRATGLSGAVASERAGVSTRTGWRYEAALAASGQAQWKTHPAPAPKPRPVTVLTPLGKGCGTFLGALLHRARGERPCPSCAAAETALRASQAEHTQAVAA
jgi:hypothetical protein